VESSNSFVGMILGAGWKLGKVAALAPFPIDPTCPELLMPLGNGETIVSRLVSQLKLLGASDVYVAVGAPDTYNLEAYEAQVARSSGYVPMGRAVWTWERVDEVRKLGVRIVPVNNPLIFGSRYESMRQLLLSVSGYKRDVPNTFVLSGDYVFDTHYLATLIAGVPSVITWILPIHDVMLLKQTGREMWLRWAREWMCKANSNVLGRQSMWKDRSTLAEYGILSHSYTVEEWREIAPYIGHKHLPPGVRPLFSEPSPDLASWEAAMYIVEHDNTLPRG